jgi:hypothetical protein
MKINVRAYELKMKKSMNIYTIAEIIFCVRMKGMS